MKAGRKLRLRWSIYELIRRKRGRQGTRNEEIKAMNE